MDLALARVAEVALGPPPQMVVQRTVGLVALPRDRFMGPYCDAERALSTHQPAPDVDTVGKLPVLGFHRQVSSSGV